MVCCACRAMGTKYEAALWGDDPVRLDAIGREALAEISRLDLQLSRFNPTSDLFEINRYATGHPVKVEPRLFRILERAAKLSEETRGAFDPTVGPLMELWAFQEGGRVPSDSEIAEAMGLCGFRHIELDSNEFTVRFRREGVQLDLGAFGKGYAIEEAADLLSEYELPGFLIHGGSSTSYARGSGPDGAPWRVRIAPPPGVSNSPGVVELNGQALSVSAPHGRAFEHAGRVLGHVLDPRTGRPTMGARLAAVVCPSAAESDALSTALLVEGGALLDDLRKRPGTSALVLAKNAAVVGPAFS